MSALTRLGAAAALTAALHLGAAPPAHAQRQQEEASSKSDLARARQLFLDGVQAARAGKWERAHDLFEGSYRLARRTKTLFNLAEAQLKTGRLTAALRSFQQFLEETRGEDEGEFQRAAQKRIAELTERVPKLRIAVAGLADGDRVELDGRAIAAAQLGRPIELDPGEHVVVVRRAGVELARRVVEVAERDRAEVEVAVPAAAAAPAPPADRPLDLVPSGEREAPATPEREGGLLRSPWFWATAAAAVIALGSAGYLYYRSQEPADPTPGTFGTIELPIGLPIGPP